MLEPPSRGPLLLAALLVIGIALAPLLTSTPSHRLEPGFASSTLLIGALVIGFCCASLRWRLPTAPVALLALVASASWLADGPLPSRWTGAGSRVVYASSPDAWREHVTLSRTPLAGIAHVALRAHHAQPQTLIARALVLIWLSAALAPERVARRWAGALEGVALAGFLGLLAIGGMLLAGGAWRQLGYDATPRAGISDVVLLGLGFAVYQLAIVSREDQGPGPRQASAACALLALGVDALSSELALRELSGVPFDVSDAIREVARTPRIAWTVVVALLWIDLLASLGDDEVGG